jgi:hypothetical protein
MASGPVVFVGTYSIPDGTYARFEAGIRDMTRFVRERVPGVQMFHTFVNAQRTQGTTLYVHPDGASLAQHLAAAAERIDAGTQLVQVERIQLLGSAPAAVVQQLRSVPSHELDTKEHLLGFNRAAAR